MNIWEGKFGDDYTDRNNLYAAPINQIYKDRCGITRRQLNELFLGDLPRDITILEVGCNIGLQLNLLCIQGFHNNLTGIDINEHAVRTAVFPAVQIASAFSIPFPDDSFDLVFTSGVLVHISPEELPKATSEICRVSKEYVWGYEYYADTSTEIPYRGHRNILWKNDFARLYEDMGLKLQKEIRIKYLDSDNVDSMFLLRKEEK